MFFLIFINLVQVIKTWKLNKNQLPLPFSLTNLNTSLDKFKQKRKQRKVSPKHLEPIVTKYFKKYLGNGQKYWETFTGTKTIPAIHKQKRSRWFKDGLGTFSRSCLWITLLCSCSSAGQANKAEIKSKQKKSRSEGRQKEGFELKDKIKLSKSFIYTHTHTHRLVCVFCRNCLISLS